jgi:hypothetical protein
VDVKHTISTLYQFTNVPTGVWIDENGRIVRPAEPAWNTDRTYKVGTVDIVSEGAIYVAALRDWVRKGERSVYVVSDEEFARRVKPRSAGEMTAEASFKLAVWFHETGNRTLAAKYFVRAQELAPDNVNYRRQDWSFTGEGAKLREYVEGRGKPFYPKLRLEPENLPPPGRQP